VGTGDGRGFGDRRCSATRSTRLDGGRRKVGPSGRVTGMLQVCGRDGEHSLEAQRSIWGVGWCVSGRAWERVRRGRANGPRQHK
jgi:hypothetical protein